MHGKHLVRTQTLDLKLFYLVFFQPLLDGLLVLAVNQCLRDERLKISRWIREHYIYIIWTSQLPAFVSRCLAPFCPSSSFPNCFPRLFPFWQFFHVKSTPRPLPFSRIFAAAVLEKLRFFNNFNPVCPRAQALQFYDCSWQLNHFRKHSKFGTNLIYNFIDFVIDEDFSTYWFLDAKNATTWLPPITNAWSQLSVSSGSLARRFKFRGVGGPNGIFSPPSLHLQPAANFSSKASQDQHPRILDFIHSRLRALLIFYKWL